MSFYTSLRDATAGPLIKKYGMQLTMTSVTKGEYDPLTGSRGADTTVSVQCYGIMDRYNSYMLANSLVRQDDQKLVLSAKGLNIEPKIGDKFTMPDGSIWSIPTEQGSLISQFQPIRKVAPAGIVIMYEIQLRR